MVQKVFVAGSLSIKRLPKQFTDRLDKVIDGAFGIVVGDAAGADAAIQAYLSDRGAKDVQVFCSGGRPRNNIGDWPTFTVESNASPGSRGFYTAKDKEMASQADYGLMVWDTKSTGTLSNVIELLTKNKKSVVFINKSKSFFNVKDDSDLSALVDLMSDSAREKAETKMGLSDRLSNLRRTQFNLL